MAYQTLAELNTGDVLPETWVDQVKENFESLRGSAVASLPTGYDNQVVRYKPLGAGSSPTWTCVFDPDLNGGIGAWAFVGGAPIEGLAATSSTRLSTVYGDLAAGAGPSIVLPVAGVYDVTISIGEMWSGIGGEYAAASYDGAGITASDAHAAIQGAINNRVSVAYTYRHTTTAGTVTAVYRAAVSATMTAARRRLTAVPVELRP